MGEVLQFPKIADGTPGEALQDAVESELRDVVIVGIGPGGFYANASDMTPALAVFLIEKAKLILLENIE